FQCFQSVLKYNRRELQKFKRGAQIESYSISKSYQCRENIAIMQVLNRIAGPVAQSCIPCLLFYAFYGNVPASAGLNLLRFICVALYDVSILNVMTCFLRCEPKFRKSIREYKQIDLLFAKLRLFETDDRIIKIAPHETNTYFDMLSRDLG
ncbi:hypothetical protein PENTCL1PPCAC_1015, partial [Pristionchus entomophagus]